jgi:catechol 2,3-dioxygenase-like lactoylglutathione lyase family enzyme
VIDVQGVDHVAFAVSDQSSAAEWFADVLGLAEEHPEWDRHPAMLMRGGSGVALFPARERPTGFLHLALRVDRTSFAEAQERLAARGIVFEAVDHGTAQSLYFDGPDGLALELTTYDV